MQQPQREIRAEDLTTIDAKGFNAVVDAYARDPSTNGLWFLSMMGTQTSLKAIAAILLKQPPDTIYLLQEHPTDPSNDEYIPCTIPPNTIRTWTHKITKLPSNQAFHSMVYTKMAEYAYHTTDFLLLPHTQEQAPHLHYTFLERRLTLPLHQSWAEWLWERGLKNKTITPIQSKGILAFICKPDESTLTEDVSKAVSQGILTIPSSPHPNQPQDATPLQPPRRRQRSNNARLPMPALTT